MQTVRFYSGVLRRTRSAARMSNKTKGTDMTKILVGVDLSRSGYVWLLTRAADLAKCLQGKIDLVYIGEKISPDQKDEAQKRLTELMAHIDPGLQGKAEVIEGELIKTLAATSIGYDVLVVGPRAPQGLRKLFEGPIAIKVISNVNCPVFVPRVEQPKKAFSRILLGVDFGSEITESRIEAAKSWAAKLGAKVDIVYCSGSASRHIEERLARDIAHEQLASAREMQREELQALVDEKLDDKVRGKAIIDDSPPGQGMAALSKDYDLILVGTADIKKSSVLLGSVSRYVVANAKCDVLTLP